jgi:D-alanyl-D-alanine carboxypeptidase
MHATAADRHRRPSGAAWRIAAAPVAVVALALIVMGAPLAGGQPPAPSPVLSLPSAVARPATHPTAAPTAVFDAMRDTAVAVPVAAFGTARPLQPLPSSGPVAVDLAPVVTPAPDGSAGGGSPRFGGGGPPACDHLDVLTPRRGLEDWDVTLLDTVYRLPAEYAPGDLVDTSLAGLNGGHRVRGLVIDDLRAMATDARAAGAAIRVVSAYRSYGRQEATFQRWVAESGWQVALRTSARAGHSEHQLGTAIDITSAGGGDPWYIGDWARTTAGAWIAANAWRYGFVVSYPAGAAARTCYSYEPWHLRYFGRERAAAIASSGLTAREVLWTLQ